MVAEDGATGQIEYDIKPCRTIFPIMIQKCISYPNRSLKANTAACHTAVGYPLRQDGENGEHSHTIEYKINLDSNPDFTANILLACARAAYRLNREGISGAKTVVDIPPAYLSEKTGEEIRRLFI